MDFDQYKIYLSADPRSQEPEFLEASRSSVQNASEHAKALAFEKTLERALRVPVPSPSTQDIMTRCLGEQSTATIYRPPVWLAMAAAVLVLVGVASVILPGGNTEVDDYARAAFVAHLEHPEPALSNTAKVGEEQLIAEFSRQGVNLEQAIADVTYLSPCLIGEKKGLHLVLTDSSGDQITVMMMPGETLQESHNFSMDSMTVQMIATKAGALALFGHQGQNLSPLGKSLARNVNRANNQLAKL